MKVLHVSFSTDQGGAAIAATRLHMGLLNLGVDSWMLVIKNASDIPNVKVMPWGVGRLLLKIENLICKFQQDPDLFGTTINFMPNKLLSFIDEINPDIVVLHWVAAGILKIEDLPKISRPIVWMMHDMWPVCGCEHYNLSLHQFRWKHGYDKISRSVGARGVDITRWVASRKIKSWKDVAITTVSPSNWLKQCAEDSVIWKQNTKCKHCVIHNGLDVDVFCPIDKQNARTALGLEKNALIVMFGSAVISSSIKGGELLVQALQLLNKRIQNFQLVTFGIGNLDVTEGIETVHLGKINECPKMAQVYNSADVMLVPSLMESFGQTASESLACGTPVVCFDTTGLKDVVDHKVCGYRAKCFDIEDFVYGVEWCLFGKRRSELSSNGRKRALKLFNLNSIAKQHQSLYRNVIRIDTKI